MGSPHGGGHTTTPGGEAKNLSLEDRSSAAEIAFVIEEGESVFTDYGISHTKEMHLIVVREDLRFFRHLHPNRDADGVWRIPFTPPAGGTYWHYADFVDADENPHTIRFDRDVPGDAGEVELLKNFETLKEVEGYRVSFDASVKGGEVAFTYTIEDAQGSPVTALEDYLGAKGHSVLISPGGDFVHTHPSSEGSGPTVTFSTDLPTGDFYRIFTQFQIEGEVITVSFDWERE